MKSRRAAAATAAIVGAAVVLAGCGGGGGGGGNRLSKSQYEQKLSNEGKALQASFGAIGSSSSSLKQLAANVAKARATAERSAGDLERITPPKDAEADNAKLVNALHVIANEMGKLEKAAKAGDESAAAKVSQDLDSSKALQEAQAAANDLKKKGYSIGVLGQ